MVGHNLVVDTQDLHNVHSWILFSHSFIKDWHIKRIN